jgi:hypothetical protein
LLDLTIIDCYTGGKMKVFSIIRGRSTIMMLAPTIMMLALLLSFLLLSPTQSASAACSKTWTASGGTSDWNTPENWIPSGVPSDTDDVCFLVGVTQIPTIDDDAYANSLLIPDSIILNLDSGGSLTVSGDVTIKGMLDNKGTLNVGGSFTNNGTYTPQANGSVVMNGTTIGGSAETSFYNLTISNTVTLGANAAVYRRLTLTSGNLVLGSNSLTIGPTATVAGTPSATNMINASGSGVVRKVFNGTGSFEYPIGTPDEYSPIEVEVTGGISGNANVDVRVSATIEPHIQISGTSYIERHWILSDGGSELSGNLTMTYLPADVAGAGVDADLIGGFHDGSEWKWETLRTPLSGGSAEVTDLTTLTGNATATEAALATQLTSFNANFTGNNVQVEWSTVSEHNNLGFNVYRSTSADSLGTQINAELIEAEAPGSSSYQYQDSTIENGMTYFYTLEDVDVDGVTTRYGPRSVDTSITTAVTLEEIGTSSTLPSGALYLLLGSVLLAGAGFILRRRSA